MCSPVAAVRPEVGTYYSKSRKRGSPPQHRAPGRGPWFFFLVLNVP